MIPDIPSQLNIASWFVDRPAQEHPERLAILGERNEVRYRDLGELTNRAGNALRILGCGPGDRVLIGLPDSVEFIAAFFGATKIGAVAVPVNPWSSTAEYRHYLADSGARLAIVDAAALRQFTPAVGERGCELVAVTGDSVSDSSEPSWRSRIDAASPTLAPYPTGAQDPAFFLYTSGSTGLPKAAVHRHKNMVVTSRSFAQGVLNMVRDDRVLSIPKLFFAYGLGNGMYFPFSVGASTILNPRKPELDTVAELIARCRPTILFAVPTFLRVLFKEMENGLCLDLSSVRLVVYGGEPAPAGLFDHFGRKFGLEMLEGFGSTEMLQTFLSNRPGQARSGTCGVEVPSYEVRLVGDDGQSVTSGEIGTLWIKGESAFTEYWNRPDLTSRAKVGDWVVTGDRFYRDADGYYHFCGRNDDLIKIAGMWASPRDVESVLCQHSGAEQAVVLATEGESGTKQLVAYVTAKDGSELSSSGLRQYLAERLPEHMLPAALFVLREFPLTGSGKIDRRSLPKPSTVTRTAGLEHHISSYVAPRTPTEGQVAEIWSAVLNMPAVGVFDDFIDLGGNSLLAMQCLFRIRKAFRVDIPLSAFFSEAADVSRLAEMVDAMCRERSVTG